MAARREAPNPLSLIGAAVGAGFTVLTVCVHLYLAAAVLTFIAVLLFGVFLYDIAAVVSSSFKTALEPTQDLGTELVRLDEPYSPI